MIFDRRTTLSLTGAVLAGMIGRAGAADTDTFDDDDETADFPALEFVTEPDVDVDALAEQIRGNVAVSLALLAQLREDGPGENLFFSPYSVSVALAMTYAGARGETADEMGDAMEYVLEDETLHAAFGALEAEFEQRNEDGADVDRPVPADDGNGNGDEGEREGEEEDGPAFQLASANAIWGDENYPFDDGYVDLLETYYGAGERLVDFEGDPEGAREEINEWVETQTNDRIEDLLPAGSVDEATRLVLTNAVYFLAAWEHEFNPDATEPTPFTSLDGTETDVETMHQTRELRYADVDGHQFVELPYANGQTSMVVLLPAEGEFESFEASLTVDRLATMLEAADVLEVELAFPRFGIESQFSLVEPLAELGMERAFDERSDFGGMEGDDEEVFIDDVVHQSFVEVDEEGTEAAAATAVVMEDEAAEPVERVEMSVDRPFLFYIRDRPTETPLFWGRVVDGETLQE
ncbi:serpin family protein [Natronolimnohabitans sp. A-GB9]|uniref:serpin family protein n=1 Tax=Natronolimnohabitans sp. A-GB9 TaxID=3069757 RepID=UPI0027B29F63|nr:serpin family protein [Natronolimnohabitans sp. A-GB9]MDQ2052353.1 serpin family protein [Natronolimnohabitans sp. A-GB9]